MGGTASSNSSRMQANAIFPSPAARILLNSAPFRPFFDASFTYYAEEGLENGKKRPMIQSIGGNTRLACIFFHARPELVWGVPTSN